MAAECKLCGCLNDYNYTLNIGLCNRCIGEKLDKLQGLLSVAKCPNCDGSGCIAHKVSNREYVTRDMASDACDPSLEGSLYSDDEWEQEQCQWCDEVKQALKEGGK